MSEIQEMKLSSLLSTPSRWSAQNEEVKEIELPSNECEYQAVKANLRGISLKYLKKITRVQNPYLFHRYTLRRLEYESRGITLIEKSLVHATAESKIPSIIKNNLDWRVVQRAKFGKGVSFSCSPEYANKECSMSSGVNRAMIFAYVLVGNKCPGCCVTKIPRKGFDTTYGRGDNVIVKYYDDEFYPAYVAYYDNLPSFYSLRL